MDDALFVEEPLAFFFLDLVDLDLRVPLLLRCLLEAARLVFGLVSLLPTLLLFGMELGWEITDAVWV